MENREIQDQDISDGVWSGGSGGDGDDELIKPYDHCHHPTVLNDMKFVKMLRSIGKCSCSVVVV